MSPRIRPYEGFFITLEGGDGSGKSTLCERLEKELSKRGYRVVKTREPGGCALSEHIREELLLNPKGLFTIGEKAELFLFLAARAQHVDELILPNLREGKIVLCERFNDSSIAYQGCARNLGMEYVEKICNLAFEDMEPDFTLFLDIDPEVGLQRLSSQKKRKIDRLEQEKLQFHRDARQGFLHLADKHPQRIAVVDASLPMEEVLKVSLGVLEPRILVKPALKSHK